MSEIELIIEGIQKRLQKDGIGALTIEIDKAINELDEIFNLSVSLESCGDYDGLMLLYSSLRAVRGELANAQSKAGLPESVLNEAINRIRNA